MTDDTTDETADDAVGPGQFADLIGLEFASIEPGYSRGTLAVRDELTNPFGRLHGAVISAMADTGMGAALYPDLAEGERCATIEIKTSYMQSVADGRLVCETTLLSRGKSVAYLESDLHHEDDDELVASATGSFSIFEP